jgi:CheY-like chemotaxis protein
MDLPFFVSFVPQKGVGMEQRNPFFRILIVEDDPARAQKFQSWLPEDVRTTIVTSAGKAMGVLKRDRGNVYAGIMLDHDLHQQAVTEADRGLSGSDLVDSIIHNVSKEVPILIHSTNVTDVPFVATRLENARFWVTRIPMHEITQKRLLEWLEDVREIWED